MTAVARRARCNLDGGTLTRRDRQAIAEFSSFLKGGAVRRCVMGIDQSLTGFGLSVLWNTGEHDETHKGFDGGIGVDRLNRISAWLTGMIGDVETHLDHVCMEGYAMNRPFGREAAGELGATVKRTLRMTLGDPLGYPTVVTPQALKKFVLGKGNAPKGLMPKGVLKQFDVDLDDGNEVDAHALARVAAAIAWTPPELKYQQDVLAALTQHTERSTKD